jgi:hypothetical protein
MTIGQRGNADIGTDQFLVNITGSLGGPPCVNPMIYSRPNRWTENYSLIPEQYGGCDSLGTYNSLQQISQLSEVEILKNNFVYNRLPQSYISKMEEDKRYYILYGVPRLQTDSAYCRDYVPQKIAADLRLRVMRLEKTYESFSIFTMICVVIAFMVQIVMLLSIDPESSKSRNIAFGTCCPLFLSGCGWVIQEVILSTDIKKIKALASLMERPCVRDQIYSALIGAFSTQMRRITSTYENPAFYMMIFGICVAVAALIIFLLALFAPKEEKTTLKNDTDPDQNREYEFTGL